MAKGKRDNAYYLQRFKKEQPAYYQDIMAKKTTVSAVRKLLGMGAVRTPLHELKNAWVKASPKEQADFLSHIGLAPPMIGKIPATAGAGAFNRDGTLAASSRKRILEIMTKRSLSGGDLSAELGLKRLNQTVMNAVHQGTRIKSAATVAALEAWLKKNARA